MTTVPATSTGEATGEAAGLVASPSKRWGALVVLCVASLIITIDQLIVAVTLPTLVRELGATASQLQWIVDAYILVFAVLLLAAGSLADRFGRRRVLIIGLAWFAAASAVASLSTTPGQLIAARAVMGVGAALIFPTTLAAISDMFRDRKEKTLAIGCWSATSGVAVAAGPIVGGFLVEHFHWGSVFLVNVPIALAGIVGAMLLVRESTNPEFGTLDLPGMGLSILGLVALVAAIIEAPHLGWTSPLVLAAFALAAVTTAAFITWERRASHPMLDLRFFRDARFRGGNLAVLVAQAMVFALLLLGVQYLQFVLDLSPLDTGLALLPFALATTVGAPVSTLVAGRIGYRPVITTGLVGMVVASALLGEVDASSPYSQLAVAMVVCGVAFGTVVGPSTEAVMSSLPEKYAGVGSATNDTTREVGGAFGVAIGGSLAASAYTAALDVGFAGSPMPAEGAAAAKESIGAADEVARLAGLQFGDGAAAWVSGIADAAFMDGFAVAMRSMAAIGAVTALVVVATLPARRKQSSEPMELDG